MKKLPKVALIGFGCVGQGFYHLCRTSTSQRFELAAICDNNALAYQSQEVEFYTNYESILQNPEIEVVVEAINSSEVALEIAKKTLASGKDLVTANKKMVCENLKYLIDLQKKTGKNIWFEAAVGGAIPIVETLDSHFAHLTIKGLKGILNGTTNYILTQMLERDLSYEQALSGAQAKGFAESNPKLDVEGFDAKNKLVILLLMAFGLGVEPEQIFNYGINFLNREDLAVLKSKGLTIKSLAQATKTLKGEIRAYVLPTLFDKSQNFSNVEFENNALEISGLDTSKVFLSGKGAGSLPTGSAVFSDVMRALEKRSYRFEKFLHERNNLEKGFSLKLLLCSEKKNLHKVFDLKTELINQISENRFWYIAKLTIEELIEKSQEFKTYGVSIFDLSHSGPFEYHLNQNTELNRPVLSF